MAALTKIQSLTIQGKGLQFKTQYWIKEDENPSKKISSDKFWSLYDRMRTDSSIVLLGPITKELANKYDDQL